MNRSCHHISVFLSKHSRWKPLPPLLPQANGVSHLYCPDSQVHVSCMDTCNCPGSTYRSPTCLVKTSSPGHLHSWLRPQFSLEDQLCCAQEQCSGVWRLCQAKRGIAEWYAEGECPSVGMREFWPNTDDKWSIGAFGNIQALGALERSGSHGWTCLQGNIIWRIN